MLYKKCGDNCALIRLCALIWCNLFILMDFPIQNDKKSMESSIMYFKVALSGKYFSSLIYFCLNLSNTGPHSAVGNVSGYRCEADSRSRGREFDPGPVPYFRGD